MLSEKEKRIVEIVKNNPDLTYQQIAEKFNLSRGSIAGAIKRAYGKDNSSVERRGRVGKRENRIMYKTEDGRVLLLTKTQLAVLELRKADKKNAQIADEVGIAENTVDSIVRFLLSLGLIKRREKGQSLLSLDRPRREKVRKAKEKQENNEEPSVPKKGVVSLPSINLPEVSEVEPIDSFFESPADEVDGRKTLENLKLNDCRWIFDDGFYCGRSTVGSHRSWCSFHALKVFEKPPKRKVSSERRHGKNLQWGMKLRTKTTTL